MSNRGSDGRFVKKPVQIGATETVGTKGGWRTKTVAGTSGVLAVLAGIVFALFHNGQPAQPPRITPIPGTSVTATSQSVETSTSTVTFTPPVTLTETTTETSPVTVVVTRTQPAPPAETVTETVTETAPPIVP